MIFILPGGIVDGLWWSDSQGVQWMDYGGVIR